MATPSMAQAPLTTTNSPKHNKHNPNNLPNPKPASRQLNTLNMEQPEDVLIVLSHERQLKFHASVLRRHSALFHQTLTAENAANLVGKAINSGIHIRWRMDLRDMPPLGPATGRLHQVALDRMGRSVEQTISMPLNENGKVPTKLYDYYENILNAFYGREIIINDAGIASALEDAVGMIEVAEYLGAVPIVSKPIDVALFKQGQVLFRSIAANPAAWVSMGIRIKSETLYREAIVHLAGNWNAVSKAAKDELVDQVRKICEKHHDKLNRRRKFLELSLAAFYPGGMTMPSGPNGHTPIKREEFAKDILVWMALSFFRHWYGQAILNERGATAKDGGYSLYKQLGAAGEAYMDRAVLAQFHDKFNMTKKAMNVLEAHLLEIKLCIKGLVDKHKILETEAQLDIHRYEVPYLTCVKLDREDFPWPKGGEDGPSPRKKVRSAQATPKRRAVDLHENMFGEQGANGTDDVNGEVQPVRGNGGPLKRTREEMFLSDEEEMDLDENEDNKRARDD